jgi:acetyl-CoA C-acetyltransferase
MTVNRFCSSGLQTIAWPPSASLPAKATRLRGRWRGSISCVQQEMNLHMLADPWLVKNKPEIYWNMLQTAEHVAKRYNIGREAMDEYGAASQQKATCRAGGRPVQGRNRPDHRHGMGVADKVMGLMTKQVTVRRTKASAPAPPMTASAACALRCPVA